MAVTWESFYTHVQPHVPGCPEIVINQHLQEAAADFCARSEVWVQDIGPDFTTAGQANYPISVPAGSSVENVLFLYVEGLLIERVDPTFALQNPTATQTRPGQYSIYEDTGLVFFPIPDDRYSFQGRVVLKPELTATGVHDYIYEAHGRSISCGALASLMVIPGKEWTNPELAGYYARKFDKACDDAKGRGMRRTRTRVRAASFA